MTQVNELKTFTATVALLNDEGVAAVPGGVEWRLKCLETKQELQAWTSLTPTVTYDDAGDPEEVTVSITVSALLHAMQTSAMTVERKALCISADRGLSTEWNDEIVYQVVRLNARS
jgi:hypothetical protein